VQGKRPCVLVVHDWWGGLNDYAKAPAEQLAGLVYVASPRMYGEGRFTTHPNEAQQIGQRGPKNLDTLLVLARAGRRSSRITHFLTPSGWRP